MQSTIFNMLAEDGVTGRGFWFPTDASASNQVDAPAFFILAICVFFVVFNAGLMVYFAYRYRQRKKEGAATGTTHNTALEVTWSIIPAVILGIIFIWGFRNYLKMETPPDDPYDILVVGKRWDWAFHYPNGHSARPWKRPGQEDADPIALHVPAGRSIRLTLQSDDVIHSVFIPELRVKKDCVPGRFNQLWFEAVWDPDNAMVREMPDGEGGTIDVSYNVYDLFCTEYCGQDHSQMITKVYVYQQEDFDLWMQSDALVDPNTSMAEIGRTIWSTQCAACHTIDGSAGSAPTWQNLIGHPNHEDASGNTFLADEEYIRESILNPSAVYAKGYPNGGMNAFDDLSPRELIGLIEFMKTISTYYDVEPEDTPVWGDFDPDGNPVGAAEPADGEAEGEQAPAEGQDPAEEAPEPTEDEDASAEQARIEEEIYLSV